MRCASCGTENAPDSRFCGGCGARLATTGPRVAPTQKISDDAGFARPGAIPQTPHIPASGSVLTTQPGMTPPRPIQTPAVTPPPAAPRPASAPLATPVVTPQPPMSVALPPPGTPSPGTHGFALTPSPRPASAPPYPRTSGAPHAANGARRGPSRLPSARLDEPSVSMPMPARRPWTLIAVVLAIDLTLAATGAWLLSEGLSATSARDTSSRAP